MYLTQEQANDKNLILYLAQQAIPEKIYSLTRLTGGVSSHSYEVNKHLIFKLPGSRTPVEKWAEQSQCAPFLQKHFCIQIPQPKLSNVFLSSSAQIPLLASVYEKIDGYTILHSKDFFQKSPSFKQKYFEQLALFAHQLHSIDADTLPVAVPTVETFLEKLFSGKMNGMTETQKNIFSRILHSPAFDFTSDSEKSVLCHCDLRPANICLNNKNDIVGILDFDSLVLGKNFMEFRPNLYGLYNKEEDTKQFCDIYYRQAGLSSPKKEFQDMRRLFLRLSVFSILLGCQNALTRKYRKAVSSIKQKIRGIFSSPQQSTFG